MVWLRCKFLSHQILCTLTEVRKGLRHSLFEIAQHKLFHLLICRKMGKLLFSLLPGFGVRNAAQNCLTLSAAPLSSCNEISPSISLVRSLPCTSSSSAIIEAKYCCLNSGLASRVDRLSLSLARLNKSTTFTARSHTCLGRAACDRMASLSRWVFDIP